MLKVAQVGNIRAMKFLKKIGLAVDDPSWFSSLDYAAHHGHLELVNWLLKFKAPRDHFKADIHAVVLLVICSDCYSI